MILRRGFAVFVLAMILIAGSVGPGDVPTTPNEACAQIWRPKNHRKHRARKKARKRKPAPARVKQQATEEVTKVSEVDDEDITELDDEDITELYSGDGELISDDENLGADVTFTEDDLATTGDAPRAVTRLETLAMAFMRLGVDTIHDPVPVTPDGVKAVGEDVLGFRGHARGEGTGRFGKRVKVKVAGRVNADFSLDADTNIGVERYEAEIWDTYVDIYGDWLDIRFGKQIVGWGVSDLLSPNDVVNARDLRRGIADRTDELRLPTLGLNATAYDGPFLLQALWIPVAPVNRFELLEGDYALLGPNAATPTERRVGALVSTLAADPMLGQQISPLLDIGGTPDNSIDTGELGARIALRHRTIDVAGYFLLGHERNPRLRVAPELSDLFINTPADMLTLELLGNTIAGLASMGTPAVRVDYPRRTHVGVSIATRLEPFGVKLEAGYSPDGNAVLVAPGAGPLLSEPRSLPQAAATASLDYDRGAELTIVFEASHLRVMDVPEKLDVYQMSHDELTLLGTRFEWNPRGGIVTLRFLGFLDISSPSYAIKPAIRFSGHDHLSLEISAAVFGGPEGSWGGVPDANDEVMFTVQYGL